MYELWIVMLKNILGNCIPEFCRVSDPLVGYECVLGYFLRISIGSISTKIHILVA